MAGGLYQLSGSTPSAAPTAIRTQLEIYLRDATCERYKILVVVRSVASVAQISILRDAPHFVVTHSPCQTYSLDQVASAIRPVKNKRELW